MPYTNAYGQTVGEPLPDWHGADLLQRHTLHGRLTRLAPLSAQVHAADLFAAYTLVDDNRDWTWLVGNRPESLAETTAWIQTKVEDRALVPFAVIDVRSERAVGVVCFMAIDRANGTVEIGHVTWSRAMKQSAIGTEAVWLLLREAFACGYRRVEWKCDSLNVASRRAAERLGFTFEGRFRKKMVRKGRNRDSDWLSIIDDEWPQVDAAIQRWLAPDNFDAQGQQLSRLRTS
ncbi:GNAT family N-acetyltransferase [Pluralibacter gergoviae]|uniref:GNAT family N-acetyltransferase n=1 Tax=Pluralibacter gergoviae TaxID=61647 RepID=A0AAI9DIF1_PLUGE|nr:GNAT family protein [Pluralibacter gergoviae]EKV0914485.1 GNAT family N-acetyltransferase [Pluralibacter gergoviae]EKV9905896.1 GNAT family N-acetyltransferase [Pluralibacter gergoviae]EKW7273811.1 GNAT family N-acetyltransferase [Pluralibacter gergoviae]ELD4293434.1 GNAT family N-acetyltransferase [Pluralibacter gergoviae]ELD4304212.1 GNAT family N-acetyltransferase [Pluralibacter gergoviae]